MKEFLTVERLERLYLEVGIGTTIFEPRHEKTGLRGFRPGPTQTELYSHRRGLED